MPTIDQLLQTLQDYIKDHAVKLLTGLILMGIGWFFGRKRAHAHWQKQEFFDRLNVSLNIIEDGMLKIRTLSEKRCESVFLNSAAVDTIVKLATKTTAQDPLLPFPQNQNWFFLNSVLNDLSEQFALGLVKRDLGGPVHSAKYLIALTCEAEGEMKTRKIRAMVIKKTLLLSLPEETPKLESPRLITRWGTLKFMAAEYARNPDRFCEIELAVA